MNFYNKNPSYNNKNINSNLDNYSEKNWNSKDNIVSQENDFYMTKNNKKNNTRNKTKLEINEDLNKENIFSRREIKFVDKNEVNDRNNFFQVRKTQHGNQESLKNGKQGGYYYSKYYCHYENNQAYNERYDYLYENYDNDYNNKDYNYEDYNNQDYNDEDYYQDDEPNHNEEYNHHYNSKPQNKKNINTRRHKITEIKEISKDGQKKIRNKFCGQWERSKLKENLVDKSEANLDKKISYLSEKSNETLTKEEIPSIKNINYETELNREQTENKNILPEKNNDNQNSQNLEHKNLFKNRENTYVEDSNLAKSQKSSPLKSPLKSSNNQEVGINNSPLKNNILLNKNHSSEFQPLICQNKFDCLNITLPKNIVNPLMPNIQLPFNKNIFYNDNNNPIITHNSPMTPNKLKALNEPQLENKTTTQTPLDKKVLDFSKEVGQDIKSSEFHIKKISNKLNLKSKEFLPKNKRPILIIMQEKLPPGPNISTVYGLLENQILKF